MTFTQEDVDNMRGFAQIVADRAKFSDMDWADAVQLAKYRAFVAAHIKRMQDHIMELTQIVEQPEPAAKKTRTRKK